MRYVIMTEINYYMQCVTTVMTYHPGCYYCCRHSLADGGIFHETLSWTCVVDMTGCSTLSYSFSTCCDFGLYATLTPHLRPCDRVLSHWHCCLMRSVTSVPLVTSCTLKQAHGDDVGRNQSCKQVTVWNHIICHDCKELHHAMCHDSNDVPSWVHGSNNMPSWVLMIADDIH